MIGCPLQSKRNTYFAFRNLIEVITDFASSKSLLFTREDGLKIVFHHYKMVLNNLLTLGRALKKGVAAEVRKNKEIEGNKAELRRQK